MRSRVLVVWCPDWPLAALGVDQVVAAVAVVAGKVVACTAAARAAGVRRGQRLRDAQRICPELVVQHSDPAREVRAFEAVVAVVEPICPRVEVVRPGVAALPVRGSARYHGGEQAVAQLVRDAVLGSGFAVAVGVADDTFTARLAARAAWADPAGQGIRLVEPGGSAAFLAPFPVSVLDDPELAGVLVQLGLRTLGDFAAVPARDVLSRFGAAGELAHRRAGGRRPRPPAPRRPRERLDADVEFDPPVELLEPVVFAAKSVADRVHENLARRGLVGARIEIEVLGEDGISRSRMWRHDGLLSSLAVAERVRWQLDAWRSTGDFASPVARLRLAPIDVQVDVGRQHGLWGDERPQEQMTRAAVRIQTLLGHAAVTRPVLVGGRDPAGQVLRVPWGDVASPDAQAALRSTVTVRGPAAVPGAPPWPGRVPAPAPSVVLPTPTSVDVRDETGTPIGVSGRSELSAVPAFLVGTGSPLRITGWAGPWPVLERWWSPANRRRCARLQVVTDDGRAWLLLVEQGRWAVEATYQ